MPKLTETEDLINYGFLNLGILMLIKVAKFSNHTKNLHKQFWRKILNIRSSSCEREC